MPSCHYWVFREGRSTADGNSLRDELAAGLRPLKPSDCDALTGALLRAGELETALADAHADDAAQVSLITDALADAIVGRQSPRSRLDSLARDASLLRVPAALDVSTPEGFSYYALHPLAYAEMADRVDVGNGYAAVLGIRSIGSTLSAVVTSALLRKGVAAQRITVRPGGHPYDRKTEFTPAELRWIAVNRSRKAEFLVVDEGPGLSGSSFLSVGDALLQAGVERRRIHFLCSHEPNPESLAAPDAAQRWRAYHPIHVSDRIPQLPDRAQSYCGGGLWRAWQYASESEWPASWSQMERAKFLSDDREEIYKFIGHGRFGSEIEKRARLLAGSGFGPKILSVSGGFAGYSVARGRPAAASDVSRTIIERIADYCALRSVEFRVQRNHSSLKEMIEFNFGQVMGGDATVMALLDQDGPAVICDSRMQPDEWILAADGMLVKTDGESHGDDHFFPGPCDIAWDLAGAAVEWELDKPGIDALLMRFHKQTGDDPRRRFPEYVRAYAVFRAAYCSMAEFAMRGTVEEQRLRREVEYYRRAIIAATSHHAERSTLSSLVPAFDVSTAL